MAAKCFMLATLRQHQPSNANGFRIFLHPRTQREKITKSQIHLLENIKGYKRTTFLNKVSNDNIFFICAHS